MPILEIVSLIFGGVGGLAQKWLQAREEQKRVEAELKLLQAKQAFELAMEDKRREYVALEAEHAANLAAIQAGKELGVAAEASLQASYGADKATYSNDKPLTPNQMWLMVLVDFTRGMTRPGLAWILVAFLGWQIATLVPSDAAYQAIIDSIRSLASLAVGWWFGARDVGSQRNTRKAMQAGFARAAMLATIAIAAAGVVLAIASGCSNGPEPEQTTTTQPPCDSSTSGATDEHRRKHPDDGCKPGS